MLKVEDLTSPPKVGEVYLVPHATVIVQNTYSTKRQKLLLPVIPNLHRDPELSNIIQDHYHYDLRFFNPEDHDILRYMRFSERGNKWRNGRTNYVAHKTMERYLGTQLEDAELVYKPLKCLRKETGVTLPIESYQQEPYGYPTVVKWMKSMEGKEAKNMRCPHKGFNLSQCPSHKGIITCPLHGLQFKKKEMKVLPLDQMVK